MEINGAILATFAIGISSISFAIIFDVIKTISVLTDRRDSIIIDFHLKNKQPGENFSQLINNINVYGSIHNLLFIIGSLSTFVSAILLITHFDFLPKVLIENSAHLLLLICSFVFLIIFSLIFSKLNPAKLSKRDYKKII